MSDDEAGRRAGFHDLCLGREPRCGCVFCHHLECEEGSVDVVAEANELLQLLAPALAFRPPMRRGDIVRCGSIDYRNEGMFLYDGSRLVAFDDEDRDYGAVPSDVSVTEFGTAHYYQIPDLFYNWEYVPVDLAGFARERETRFAPGTAYEGFALYEYRRRARPGDAWYIVSHVPPETRSHFLAVERKPEELAALEGGGAVPLHRLLQSGVVV